MDFQRHPATKTDVQLLRSLKTQLTPSENQATNILVDKAQLGRDVYQLLKPVPKELLKVVLSNFSESEVNDIILNVMCMVELKQMTLHIVQNYQKLAMSQSFSTHMYQNLADLAKKDQEDIIESEYRELLYEIMAFKVKYDITKMSQVQKIYNGLLKGLVSKSTKH